MPEQLKQAIQEAQAGRMFMESSLADQAMTADGAQAAKEYIDQHADYSAYILLMALRKDYPQVYGSVSDTVKAKVLCDAMRKVTFLNDFGCLDPSESYDGDAAKALIDVGKPAVEYLSRLLGDKSEAPLFGSQEATLSIALHYRRADFAYRYIMLILDRKPTFPADLAERDKLIAELQKEFDGN